MDFFHDFLIAIAPTVAGVLLGWIVSTSTNKNKRDKNIEETLRLLVKAIIMDDYERYVESDNPPKLSVARKEMLLQLGNNYEKLGGNGTGAEMVEAIKKKHVVIIASEGKEPKNA